MLGLLVLAVVSGIINAAASGGQVGLEAVGGIVLRALVFLVGALAIGSFVSPRLFKGALALRSRGVVQALSLSLCFGMSYLAALAGMAPIVGAFAAGLVLEDVHFQGQVERGEHQLHETLEPLIALLVPVFFARMGMLVDLQSFASGPVLAFAAVLTAAAVAGKLVCGLVVPPDVSRLTVGLGMMPRGEVGLIFAGIGGQLMLHGRPVVDPSIYAAAVFMVVMTTLLTPPLLTWSIRAARASATAPADPGGPA